MKLHHIDFDVQMRAHAAVIAGDFIFLSGFAGGDYKTGKVVRGLESQIDLAFQKLIATLEAAGSSLDNIVKVTTYLTRPDKAADVHRITSKYWKGMKPPSTLVIVKRLGLPGLLIEIDATAVRSRGGSKPKKVVKGWDKNLRKRP